MGDAYGIRVVPERTRTQIRKDTYKIRKMLHMENEPYFDIMSFLESKVPLIDSQFYVEPVNDELLPGRLAETLPEQHRIRVRESVYLAACNGHTWARQIMAHEFGHYLYHDSESTAFATPALGEIIPKRCLPEYQANVFASELLAPVNLVRGMNPNMVSQRFGVTVGAAYDQLKQAAHTKKGRKKKKAAKLKRLAACR